METISLVLGGAQNYTLHMKNKIHARRWKGLNRKKLTHKEKKGRQRKKGEKNRGGMKEDIPDRTPSLIFHSVIFLFLLFCPVVFFGLTERFGLVSVLRVSLVLGKNDFLLFRDRYIARLVPGRTSSPSSSLVVNIENVRPE